MSCLDRLDQQSLDVRISELLVAIADGYDAGLDCRITEVLLMLRRQLGRDVVFVSGFVNGERVMRLVDGDAAPLQASYCQRVVQGRLRELVTDAAPRVARGELPDPGIPVAAHLSTPVVLHDGQLGPTGPAPVRAPRRPQGRCAAARTIFKQRSNGARSVGHRSAAAGLQGLRRSHHESRFWP